MRAASHRYGVLLAGVAMLLGRAGDARQAPEPPTFRAGTTLIEFTVVAEDEHGNPVSDLRPDEIAIVENGRPRAVVFFRFEGAPGVRPTVLPLPGGIFSNRPEYSPGPERNVTAIVIDAVNTRPQDQVQVRDQILRHLLQSPPETRVAIYRAGERVHILHDFTNDYESLRARLATHGIEATPEAQTQVSVKVEAPIIEEWMANLLREYSEAMLQRANEDNAYLEERSNQQIHDRRSEVTLRALDALGTHLAGIPGRKNLVWISSGSPIMTAGSRDPWLKNYEAAVRATAQRLASQGITIYPVEATGIRPPDLALSPPARGSTRGAPNTAQTRAAAKGGTVSLTSLSTTPDGYRAASTMDLLADVTGGRVSRNTNDLAAGVKAAAADLQGTYSLGFYAQHEADDRWHGFTVKAHRTGLKLRHRRGYLASIATKQSQEWLADQWRAVANVPLQSTAVRFDARAELVNGTLSVIIQVPAEDLDFRRINDAATTELEIAIAERAASGLLGIRHELGSFKLQDSEAADLTKVTVRFRKQWPLDPSTSLIRLVIRDRFTGHYGTLDVPVAQLR